MIKNTKRRTVIKGDVPTLMTDLTTIVRRLDDTFQNGAGMTKELSKEVIMHCFELAFKSNAEVLGDTLKMIFDMASGSDKDGEKYKVWCETNEIRDKVLVALENRGFKWAIDGKKPVVYKAPMGFIVDQGIWQTQAYEKELFDGLKFEELKAEDLIKEVEGNE